MRLGVTHYTKTLAILSAIIVALVVFIVVFNNKDHTPTINRSKQKIDSLDKQIAVLKKEQAYNDSLISSWKSKIKLIDTQINKQQDEITKIKKQYGATIQSVNNYTPSELDSFFTNRYKR